MVRLQDGRYMRFVEASRIAFAESRGDYTCILVAGGKPVTLVVSYSLGRRCLAAMGSICCHRPPPSFTDRHPAARFKPQACLVAAA